MYSAPLGEIRTASTAGGGTALTTTAALIVFPKGTIWYSMTPRNFVTGVVAKVAANPYLVVLKTTDALAAVGNLTDGSENLQDAAAGTTLVMDSFDTAANLNFLYVGAHLPFRGAAATIGNTNSGAASTLTVKYWNGTAWTDITATDGTAAGGKTFAQSGNVTWTVPTGWVASSLRTIGATTLYAPADLTVPYFWTRWETSAVFDASVTLTALVALNRDTSQYAELLSGQPLEQRIHRGKGGYAAVEALMDAGTGNLVLNVAAGQGGFA